ncbi:TPA: hypothetical protein ACH3X1_014107 [Trebouxia sp. C0004]
MIISGELLSVVLRTGDLLSPVSTNPPKIRGAKTQLHVVCVHPHLLGAGSMSVGLSRLNTCAHSCYCLCPVSNTAKNSNAEVWPCKRDSNVSFAGIAAQFPGPMSYQLFAVQSKCGLYLDSLSFWLVMLTLVMLDLKRRQKWTLFMQAEPTWLQQTNSSSTQNVAAGLMSSLILTLLGTVLT